MLDRGLRVPPCSLQARLNRWSEEVYGISSWRSAPTRLSLPSLAAPRIWELDGVERHVHETWLCSLLQARPSLPGRFVVPSMFVTNAPEINAAPTAKDQVYNFRGCAAWYNVGLQILSRAGRRPDRAAAEPLETGRLLPPKFRRRAWSGWSTGVDCARERQLPLQTILGHC